MQKYKLIYMKSKKSIYFYFDSYFIRIATIVLKHKFVIIYLFFANQSFLINGQKKSLNESELSTINKSKNLKKEESKITEEILDSLQKNGYIQAHLSKKTDHLVNKIYYGNYYEYIYIEKKDTTENLINKDIYSKKASKFYKIPIKEITVFLEKIKKELNQQGYVFAKVNLYNFEIKNQKLTAKLQYYKQKKKRVLDTIVIKGYTNFPRSYLKYFCNLKKKEHINTSNILKKTNNLEQIPFVEVIKTAEILFNPDRTSLYLYLKKQRQNQFEGIIGFLTEPETGKLQFNGHAKIKMINLFNRGETLAIDYEKNTSKQSLFDINIKWPFIFKSPIGIEANLNLFHQIDQFTRNQQKLIISYPITSKLETKIGYSSQTATSNINRVDINESLQSYVSNFGILSLLYQKRNPKNSHKPFKYRSEITYQKGERNQNRQQKIYFKTAYEFKLTNKSNLYLQNENNVLLSSDYISDELERFGGIDDLRGYEENSLLGNTRSTYNIEYHYLLNPNISTHTITDAGYFENKVSHTKGWLYGFGAGISIIQKNTLLKFNYVLGKRGDQKINLSEAKVHLKLVSYF